MSRQARARRPPENAKAMDDKAPLIHLIHLRSGAMIVSRRPYEDWREIQGEYEDYMTSTGPFTAEGLIEFLSDERARRLMFPATRRASSCAEAAHSV